MKKIEKTIINNAALIALLMCVLVLASYFFKFHNQIISEDATKWGVFGDFVGGTLNPLLSFLALMILLRTFSMQRKELKYTKKALKKQLRTEENNVKLSALMAICQEDVKKFNNNKDIIENYDDLERKGILDCIEPEDEHDIRQSYKIASKTNEVLNDRRTIIFAEIEKILRDSGVAIPEMPMD